jgi:transposase
MLIPSGSFKVFYWPAPLDMRAGIDRIAHLVKTELGMSPYGGAVFLFFSRDRTRAKIYFFDGSGSCLFLKRLERGRYQLPETAVGARVATIASSELALLLEGCDVRAVRRPKARWVPKESEKEVSDQPLA